MLIEQTEIAKKLGMSNNKFKKLIHDKLEFQLINNKRHYEWEEVLRFIQLGRGND